MRKEIIIVISMLFCCSTYGQSPVNLNLSFNHMALSVKDVNRSADFYKNVLGLQEITNRAKMDGIRWFSLREGKELHLVSIVKDTVIINKAVHIALTTNNFDDLLKILNANKIVYSDWPGTPNKVNIRADGIKQVFFQDPNGYWIEVNSVGQK
ncbi:MAG: VOC family protein [Prolixibacteraceae bacterium]|nr:VOC family protein [Prolixibacteraceae bacterium]